MRVPMLAATLVLAAPLMSCDHRPSTARTAVGTQNTPLQPRDEAAARASGAKAAVANDAEVQQSASASLAAAALDSEARAAASSRACRGEFRVPACGEPTAERAGDGL